MFEFEKSFFLLQKNKTFKTKTNQQQNAKQAHVLTWADIALTNLIDDDDNYDDDDDEQENSKEKLTSTNGIRSRPSRSSDSLRYEENKGYMTNS